MVACIFPGQGAQFVGMGADLAEQYRSANDVYRKADEILGYSIREVSFDGPSDRLTATAVQQPAILTMSVAALRALEELGKVSCERTKAACGLSLGEYSALVFAGVLTFEDALRIVARRAELMEEAGRKRAGGMLSVLGLDMEKVEEIRGEAAGSDTLAIANANCPGQVVLSGDQAAIERAQSIAEQCGASRVVRLEVSGAFHSPLMEPAQRGLEQVLAKVDLAEPRVPFVSNVTASCERSPARISKLLVRQLGSSVLWQKSMELLVRREICDFVEIGPGNVLRGLLRRIEPKAKCVSAGTVEAIEKL